MIVGIVQYAEDSVDSGWNDELQSGCALQVAYVRKQTVGQSYLDQIRSGILPALLGFQVTHWSDSSPPVEAA